VVAESGDHPRQRHCLRAQVGPATVALETNQRPVVPHCRNVADTARHRRALMDSHNTEDAAAGQALAHRWRGVVAEELIAPAYEQSGDALLDSLTHGLALRFEQVLGDLPLLLILSAAHEDQVVGVGVEGLARPDGLHAQSNAAP